MGGLLVAGGSKDSSTEVYLSSNGRWTSGGNLPRALFGLRAAHLNQRVVVTGGKDYGFNIRDEVLEYDGSTWSEKKERMEIKRFRHAIVEANLPTLCSSTGATRTTGLDPLLALLVCLVMVCSRGCNNSCTLQGVNKQSL